LSVWALIQYYTGDFKIIDVALRTNTIFFTPNTFAAAINLVLFPLIAINLRVKQKPLIFIVMLLLFYALILTKSRGGHRSFVVVCGVIFLLNYLSGRKYKLNWLKVLSGFIGVYALFNCNSCL